MFLLLLRMLYLQYIINFYSIIAFSMCSWNPLLNLDILESHPYLQVCLWYISLISYKFDEIRSKNYVKHKYVDDVGHLNTANKF